MSKYVIINRDSLSIRLSSPIPLIVRRETPGYQEVLRYCLDCDDPSEEVIHDLLRGGASLRIPKVLRDAVDLFAPAAAGVGIVGLPVMLNSQILTAIAVDVTENPEHLQSYRKFFERARVTPDPSAITGLLGWIVCNNLSILPDGRFVAYKGVARSYLDIHTSTIMNTPGTYVEMPRDQVDADGGNTCSYGLNIATYKFARDYGHRCLRVLVDPADVVCVPTDNVGKIRVCRYYIDKEVNSDSLDDLDDVVSADVTKATPEVTIRLNTIHSRWSASELKLLSELVKRRTTPAGNVDWEQVASVLGRSAEACSRQHRRMVRGK